MTKLLILVGVLDKLAGLWSEHAEASTSRGEGMTAAECDMNFMSVGGFSVFGASLLQRIKA